MARIGSRVEFSSARARGSTASTDTEGLALTVQDSEAVVSDSTAAEVGSLDPVGVASLPKAALEGDSPAAAPDEDSLAALRGDPAVVSEAVPWVVGSTAVADLMAVAATGNCWTLLD
jgi:hypothetical protein